MNISIIGAAGGVGRELTISMIQEGLLDKNERLQLIGRKGSKSEHKLYGLRMDISDSFSEINPYIDITNSPDEIYGDIVVMVAGEPLHLNSDNNLTNRDQLAAKNSDLFYLYAESIAKHKPNAIVIIISNPVELGVHIFSKYIYRYQVLGMGAFIDTLRFRREIAEEFGVRRERVQGFVLGEHGMGFVPVWSSVKVYGEDEEKSRQKLESFYNRPHKANLLKHWEDMSKCLEEGRIDNFCESIHKFTPDERAFLSPFISNYTGAHALAGASGAAIRLIRSMTESHETLSACQVKVEGEFLGINSVIGAPVVVCNKGILSIENIDGLWDNEKTALKNAGDIVNEKLIKWEK